MHIYKIKLSTLDTAQWLFYLVGYNQSRGIYFHRNLEKVPKGSSNTNMNLMLCYFFNLITFIRVSGLIKSIH